MILTKICVDCQKEKPWHNFHRRGDDKTKRLKRCKPCQCAKAKQYRDAMPLAARSNYLKRRFGITLKSYRDMFEAQSGACAMCKRRSERSLCVDHDHVTGKVRALLCNSCNAMIGFAQEDAMIVQSALSYLMKYKTGYRK